MISSLSKKTNRAQYYDTTFVDNIQKFGPRPDAFISFEKAFPVHFI